jgi:hypothetical protein
LLSGETGQPATDGSVCRHTPCGYEIQPAIDLAVRSSKLLHRSMSAVDEHVDHGGLKTRCEVCFALVGQGRLPPDDLPNGRLQAGEGEVRTLPSHHRPRQREAPRVAITRHALDLRTTWIGKA